ncbi:T9SS response regulator signal transducer PorX [Calditrichota bacterium GD2]
MPRILWVDDEIERLQAHILFLKEKGYEVATATNGDDALYKVKHQDFDLVLIDEMMPGKDGLTTLNEIKDLYPYLPVIMITKNEEESLMEEAIGQRIDDYLTKPVNPSQILMACKKILDRKNIIEERRTQVLSNQMSQLSLALMNPLSINDWIDLALKVFKLDMDLDELSDQNFRSILYEHRRELNVEFGKFVEKNYGAWVHSEGQANRPVFSTDIIKNYILPLLKKGKKVAFIVIDCLRLDQWLSLEPYFSDWFRIEREHYYSILPTATPFSRNALFSGLFPEDIEKYYPDLWSLNEDDESLNRYEKELLDLQLKRNGLDLGNKLKYVKIMNNEDLRRLSKSLNNLMDARLLSIVVNIVDIIAHSRSDLPILKEIAPDEAAFRTLTRSWFEHSPLLSIIREIGKSGTVVFITSDHGSVRGLRGTRVIGDRETSTNLRYKYGRSLKADPKHTIFIKEPAEWRLPKRGINTTYVFAKEDFYLVYPTNYNKYLHYYKDSFQHGGVSLEEMLLPIVRLESKE